MGLMCSIWGHSEEAINLLDNEGNFTLFRCRRCKREIIHCAYEGEILNNDDEGRKVMAQMQSDPEFSKQCHIYWRFVQVETNNSFKYDAQEKGFDEIRKEFSLPPGYRQPNPLILFKKGLWKPKADKKGGEKKKVSYKKVERGETEVSLKDGESRSKSKPKKNKFVLSEQDKISFMKDKLASLVMEEKYEEAAKLRDEIEKKMREKQD